MAIDKIRNPFNIPTSFVNPAIPANIQQMPTSIMPAAGKVNFGSLVGRTKEGPGSLLATNEGEQGLGDRAILTKNGELGRKLFLSA
jgi:hypothetical protein